MLELAHITLMRNGMSCLVDVSCVLHRAERVALVGASGSGKSSLARIAVGSLDPQMGTITRDGSVGLVRQDPVSQIVSSTVLEEVAFGPANLGLPRDEVLARAHAAEELCGLQGLEQRQPTELSGGQQQRLALASVLALEPQYLVLDEAGSMLDPLEERELSQLVDKLVTNGKGVLEISHERANIAAASRVVMLEQGKLIWEGSSEDFLASDELCARAGLRRSQLLATPTQAPQAQAPMTHARATTAELIARSIHLSAMGRPLLHGVDFEAAPGELTLLVGASGAGKTSLARVLAGVLTPDAGSCTLAGKPLHPAMVGLALQRPEDQLFCETVAQDIAFAPRMQGLNEQACTQRVQAVASALGLETLLNRAPRSLSGGERRRAALASIAAQDTAAYVFDEPGAGLDGQGRAQLQSLIDELVGQGRTVVVITHDIDEWLGRATRVFVMLEGKIAWQGSAAELSVNSEPLVRAGLRVGDAL